MRMTVLSCSAWIEVLCCLHFYIIKTRSMKKFLSGITIFIFLISHLSLFAQPTSAPDAPTCDAADVISMFSDAYTDVGGINWRLFWSGVNHAEPVDQNIAGNDVKYYTDLSFVGIEPSSTIDASSMTHFNFQYWTPNMTELRIKLVDYGPNGVWNNVYDPVGNPGSDDREDEIVISSPAQGEWTTVSLPLSDFINVVTGDPISFEKFAQLIFSGEPNGSSTLYIDNVFFSNGACPSSAAVAPIPTLGEWGLICMSLLLLIGGIVIIRQRSTTFGMN